jgi:hypothetical protein
MAAFSGDMDPEINQFLQSTKVDVTENQLKVSVTLTPEAIVSALDEV